MDFRFTDAQLALRDSVRAYLDAAHPPALLRRLSENAGPNEDVRRGLLDLGLPGLLIPEDAGGLGLGLTEGVLIAEELGRANVSDAIVETALVAAPWLARCGKFDVLPDLAAGRAVIALAHGVNPWVADLDVAQWVLCEAGLHAAAPAGSRIASIDPLRRLFPPLANPGADALLLDLAALMSAARMVGAAERMVAMAVDYAKIRRQFGQAIGGFQAVKHMLASSSIRLEFAKPVLWRAAWALENNAAHASVHVSHAKLAATQAALLAAETAIQVHGAMGYTYEVDLHFWMKRVWALAGAWGDQSFHQHRVDEAVLGGEISLGPGETF
jgi:alkylation response protein AidB-like acyl-CoA dehydrogenase